MKQILLLSVFLAVSACSPNVSAQTKTEEAERTTWQSAINQWGDKEFIGGTLKERLGTSTLTLTCNNGHMMGQIKRPGGFGSGTAGGTTTSLSIISHGYVLWTKDVFSGYGAGRDIIAFHLGGDIGVTFRDVLKQGRLDIYITDFNEAGYYDSEGWGKGSGFDALDEACKT